MSLTIRKYVAYNYKVMNIQRKNNGIVTVIISQTYIKYAYTPQACTSARVRGYLCVRMRVGRVCTRK